MRLIDPLLIIDYLELGVLVIDEQGRVLVWNRWLERYSKVGVNDAVGKQFSEIFPEVKGSRIENAIKSAIENKLASLLSPGLNPPILRLYKNNQDMHQGKRLQQLVHIIPLAKHAKACLVQIQDVTASIKRENQLRVQSAELRDITYRDPLTGIANRRKFNEMIYKEFREASLNQKVVSLLMIDIDYFKAYNDNHGHQAGDDCIKLVASILLESVKLPGSLVSRYGGEEFAIVLPGLEIDQSIQLAEQIRYQVAEAEATLKEKVTISVGVATLQPNSDIEMSTLISEADAALYQAKANGRNCVVTSSNLLTDSMITDLAHSTQ